MLSPLIWALTYKKVLIVSYLHHGNPYIDSMIFLYCIVACQVNNMPSPLIWALTYKTVLTLSYLHNGNPYIDSMAFLYWIGTCQANNMLSPLIWSLTFPSSVNCLISPPQPSQPHSLRHTHNSYIDRDAIFFPHQSVSSHHTGRSYTLPITDSERVAAQNCRLIK